MALTLIVTNAGRAAIVNAANTGTAPVTIAQVGLSATALTPLATDVALPGEFKRLATLSGDVVDDDTIHVIVRDESTEVFTVRSIALYLNDGTLFGIYGQAAVLIEKSAQAMMLLGIDVRFEDIDATDITFGDANFLNPPATIETQGVVELSTEDEATTGVDTQRAVTPKGLKTAVTSWLNNRFGDGAPSAFVKGLLTAVSAGAMRLSLELKSAALKDEGAGNGLDADLLDGQHGAYYGNIPARLGYVPWGPSNDGAGSGLDADLLDGQDSAYFTNIPARLGFTPVRQGGGSGQLGNVVYIGWSGARVKVQIDATDMGNVVFDGHIADVWRASNDGAGSGLDADLLDGQQGSYYTDIAARLGYSPLNSTAYTAADVKAKLLTVDGSGSGFDADLLDGLDGSYYTNIVARLGYTPLNRGGDTATGRIVFASGVSGNSGVAAAPGGVGEIEVRGNGVGAAIMTFHRPGAFASYFGLDTDNIWKVGGWSAGAVAYTLWHSGNDGSGSGLDADTVDGWHMDSIRDWNNLLNRPFDFGSNANGYWEKRPNGVIEQWGKVTQSQGEGPITRNFPIPFTDLASISVQVTLVGQGNSANDMWVQLAPTPASLSQFAAYYQAGSSGNSGAGFTWRAIGR